MGLASFFELTGVFRLMGIDPASLGPTGVTEDVSSEVTSNNFDPLGVLCVGYGHVGPDEPNLPMGLTLFWLSAFSFGQMGIGWLFSGLQCSLLGLEDFWLGSENSTGFGVGPKGFGVVPKGVNYSILGQREGF